jgi:type I restriction enzyme S subunit
VEVKPGYQLTEVGVIPNDWAVRPLSEHFRIYAGGDAPKHSLSHTQSPTHPYPVFANALSNRGLYGYTAERRSSGDSVTITARGYLGHAEYRSSPFFPIVRLLVLEPIGELDARFSAYAINETVDFALESTGVPQLTAPQVGKYRIGAPHSIEEQRKIASALADVDALLVGMDCLIAKKRDLKQAAMQQLLTGQTRLPGFQGEWVLNRLGETASLKARIGWQGLTTAEYLDSGEFFLVTGTEIIKGYIEWSRCHFVDEVRYEQDTNIQLRPRDVLVTKDGTIGKVALVPSLPGPATLNSGVFVIRPLRNSFHPEFFYYVLCSRQFSDFLSQLAAGSTISHLYQKDFVSFAYRTPASLEEQAAIAKILADMDAELTALEARRDKTRALKQGMMQELLTGRTRLV